MSRSGSPPSATSADGCRVIAPTASMRRSCAFRSKYSGAATAVIDTLDCELLFQTIIARSANRYGSDRSSTASSTLKIAVLAPMASAIVRIATAANSGLRRERAERELDVHSQFLPKLGAAHVGLHVGSNDATFVANAVEIAKARRDAAARVGFGHALFDVASRLQLDVRRELLGDLALDRRRARRGGAGGARAGGGRGS